MIKRSNDYQVDCRKEMRGGSGDVIIEHLWDCSRELKANNRLFARLTLNPGCSIGFHRHENEEEVFVVISGRAEADDNGKTTFLEAGDTILTADGAGHAIKCIGNEPLVMLAVISAYDVIEPGE